MFEWIGSSLSDHPTLSFLRVLQYITVRAGLALAFSFVFCVICGPSLIRWLRRLQAIQYIRDSQGDGAISLQEMHKSKAGTPSMGGLLMLGALVASFALFVDFAKPAAWMVLIAAAGFSGIGFADDYLKAVKKNSAGLSARAKLVWQILLGGLFAAAYLWMFPEIVRYEISPSVPGPTGPAFLLFPFLKSFFINLGILYIPFAILVLTATSNAVNLTDGLDGLAAGVTISATLCFVLVAYLASNAIFAAHLYIPVVDGAGELTVLLASLTGACFGFLWFNSHPAELFMGDTGSMMLGGLLGSVALIIKQEFLLLLVGGVFVAEALSVILQVGSYKLRKKRILRMAPLHHHFERGGIPESKIIARFWIVSALLALAGLVTLKIR